MTRHSLRVLALMLPAVVIVSVAPLSARPRPGNFAPAPVAEALPFRSEGSGRSYTVAGLQSGVGHDTAWFGGTAWAADSNRWEAIPGGTWTFDSGIGSALLSSATNGKPAGYHRLMEGWTGGDLSVTTTSQFRRSTTCAIAGSYSMWAGVTEAEAAALGWPGGQGYGNSWGTLIEQTFAYPGSGTILLEFDYAVDSEPTFDFLRVRVRRSDSAAVVEVAAYDGLASGTASILLSQGTGTLPAAAGSITIEFVAESDGSYSDEDGLFASACGLAAIDDIQLSGAIAHFASFETDADGWTVGSTIVAGADLSDVRHIADLSPTMGFPNNDCGLEDSVVVFVDPFGGHPDGGENWIVSPWIDLLAVGEAGRPGAVMKLNYDSGTQLSIAPAFQVGAQYYPYTNPWTGLVGPSPWTRTSIIFYFGTPVCGSVMKDLSSMIPPGAEQVRITIGPTAYPTGEDQPYIDNVRFGVYGTAASDVPPEVDPPVAARGGFSLGPGRPNPTSGGTKFTLIVGAAGSPVRVNVFDVAGRLVRTLVDSPMPAGAHELTWDGNGTDGLPAETGLYFTRASSGEWLETRKLILLR